MAPHNHSEILQSAGKQSQPITSSASACTVSAGFFLNAFATMGRTWSQTTWSWVELVSAMLQETPICFQVIQRLVEKASPVAIYNPSYQADPLVSWRNWIVNEDPWNGMPTLVVIGDAAVQLRWHCHSSSEEAPKYSEKNHWNMTSK